MVDLHDEWRRGGCRGGVGLRPALPGGEDFGRDGIVGGGGGEVGGGAEVVGVDLDAAW